MTNLRFKAHTTSMLRGRFAQTGALCALLLGAAYGCGEERPEPFDGDVDGDVDGDGSGGSGFGNDGPSDGPGPNNGNPTYQPNFIERGQPPGPPTRGYTAVEAELSGDGAGELCALCADSADCAAGACLIHMDTGEMFCAAECESDLDCPDPQAQECVSAEGASQAQCVPRLGTCYEFDADAEPINPINEPPDDLGPPDGQGGQGGAG
jgi:hypothetical protein